MARKRAKMFLLKEAQNSFVAGLSNSKNACWSSMLLEKKVTEVKELKKLEANRFKKTYTLSACEARR